MERERSSISLQQTWLVVTFLRREGGRCVQGQASCGRTVVVSLEMNFQIFRKDDGLSITTLQEISPIETMLVSP